MNRWILLSVITLIIAVIGAPTASACTIKVSTSDDKDIKVGEDFVVVINVSLTHRNCTIKPEETKIDVDGLKVIAATKWKEVEPGKLERKLKVSAERIGEVSITASRTCKKEGGKGTLTMDIIGQ